MGLRAELEKGMGVLGHLASKVSSSSLRCAPSQATLAPPTSLNNVKSDLLMVWICFFLMTNDAEYLFMYLLAIWIFFCKLPVYLLCFTFGVFVFVF